jgi:hypothetical protein
VHAEERDPRPDNRTPVVERHFGRQPGKRVMAVAPGDLVDGPARPPVARQDDDFGHELVGLERCRVQPEKEVRGGNRPRSRAA